MRWVAVFGLVLVALTGCRSSATNESAEPASAAFDPLPSDPPLTAEELATPKASPKATAYAVATRAPVAKQAAPKPAGAAPAGRASCPSGSVSIELTDFKAVEDTKRPPDEDGQRRWDIRASGIAYNGASHAVRSIGIHLVLHVENDHASAHDTSIDRWVGTGTQAGWSMLFGYKSARRPSDGDVRIALRGYSWGDPALSSCPTPGGVNDA